MAVLDEKFEREFEGKLRIFMSCTQCGGSATK